MGRRTAGAVSLPLSSRPMAVAEVQGIDGLKALIGKEIGPGEWREVRQEDIDLFADLSGDHQWIHVDRERAERESPSARRSRTAT